MASKRGFKFRQIQRPFTPGYHDKNQAFSTTLRLDYHLNGTTCIWDTLPQPPASV